MMLNIIIALVAVVWLFSIAMVLLSRRRTENDNINNRMAFFAGVDVSLRHTRQSSTKHYAGGTLRQRLLQAVQSLGAKFAKFKKSNSFDQKMQQAGWPFLGSEFQVILLGCGAVGAVILGVLTMEPINAILGFIAGCIVCMLVLSIAIQRRQKAFINQLGDMLTMIANALRAGFSFMQALDHIANEMDDPVRSEVQRVVRDVNVGRPLEEALDAMTKRINSPDFNLVAAAVLIQRQVGGNLAQILDTISETINERIRMRREVNALTAQGRMSGYVLSALPIALALILQIISPGYLMPLFTSTMGQMAVGGAVLLMIIGAVVIRRIVDINL